MEKKPTKPSNRRNAMRMPPRRTVKVECRKGAYGFGRNLAVDFLDISEGGVRMVLNDALAVADEVEVILLGYGMAKSIKRLADVRWIYPIEGGNWCVGLEFQKRLPYREVHVISAP